MRAADRRSYQPHTRKLPSLIRPHTFGSSRLSPPAPSLRRPRAWREVNDPETATFRIAPPSLRYSPIRISPYFNIGSEKAQPANFKTYVEELKQLIIVARTRTIRFESS